MGLIKQGLVGAITLSIFLQLYKTAYERPPARFGGTWDPAFKQVADVFK